MTDHADAVYHLLKNNKGFVTASQITEAGIPRRCLTEMAVAGTIYKVDRGIYALPEAWEDELYFLQYRFTKGIYSHETALYLHSMTDRTPISYTMTFPKGYNTGRVRKQHITTKYIMLENYELGLTEAISPCGNQLNVYDIERTLCDIAKVRHAVDIQVINQAMKAYASSKKKDIGKLINYAEKLNVKTKVLTYIEVLL